MSVQVQVPPVPDGLHPAACWRRTIGRLHQGKRGGYTVEGHHLSPGDTVALPEGTLVLQVDKATRGWEQDYHRPLRRHPVEDSTVTAYLATADGLAEVWSRAYASSKSAFGMFTLKKLAALLERHPAPGGEPVVVVEVQRPNTRAGECRWCAAPIGKGAGHLVRAGEETLVEHYRDCPPRDGAGQVCAVCNVTIRPGSGSLCLVREGGGRWEPRHRADLDCWENEQASFEQARAEEDARRERQRAQAEREREAARRTEDRKERQRAKRREARAAKEARAEAEHAAEQARVAGLGTTARVSQTLFDKGLGDGLRVRLREHRDTLTDGTTTLRWSVETYGTGGYGQDADVLLDGDGADGEVFTRLADARHAYQQHQFDPGPRPLPAGGGVCDNCGRGGARFARRDSSGIGGWVCAACNRDDSVELSFA